MAKRTRETKRKNLEAVETEPDAWDRFTDAVQKIASPKRPKVKQEKSDARGSRSYKL
jgi:hypothetical protein